MPQFGPGPSGANEILNLGSVAVVKASPGVLYSVSVTAAGTATGGVYDAIATTGTVAANLIGQIGTAVTDQPLQFNWNCQAGIVIKPPTGGTVSVSFI